MAKTLSIAINNLIGLAGSFVYGFISGFFFALLHNVLVRTTGKPLLRGSLFESRD